MHNTQKTTADSEATKQNSSPLCPQRYSRNRREWLWCGTGGEPTESVGNAGVRGERRQAVCSETFRMVDASRRRDALRIANAVVRVTLQRHPELAQFLGFPRFVGRKAAREWRST